MKQNQATHIYKHNINVKPLRILGDFCFQLSATTLLCEPVTKNGHFHHQAMGQSPKDYTHTNIWDWIMPWIVVIVVWLPLNPCAKVQRCLHIQICGIESSLWGMRTLFHFSATCSPYDSERFLHFDQTLHKFISALSVS